MRLSLVDRIPDDSGGATPRYGAAAAFPGVLADGEGFEPSIGALVPYNGLEKRVCSKAN